MKRAKHCLVLFFTVMFFLCMQTVIMAGDDISILGNTVKAVGTMSSGKNIKVAWEVQVRNETAQPITKEITVTFLNDKREALGKVSKVSALDVGKVTIVTDVVVLPLMIAEQIRIGVVTTKGSGGI